MYIFSLLFTELCVSATPNRATQAPGSFPNLFSDLPLKSKTFYKKYSYVFGFHYPLNRLTIYNQFTPNKSITHDLVNPCFSQRQPS